MKYEFRFYRWRTKNNEFQNGLELLWSVQISITSRSVRKNEIVLLFFSETPFYGANSYMDEETVTYRKKDIINILKDSNMMVVSLDRIGSQWADRKSDGIVKFLKSSFDC